MLFLHMSYECNLRAYLVSVDYEKPLDSEKDVLDMGRRLYLPRGQTSLLSIFRDSPTEVQSQDIKSL